MRLRGIGPEVLLLCFIVVGAAAFALGRRTSLQINVPRLFSEHYRQAQLILSVGI